MDAILKCNEVVFFQDRDVAIEIAKALGGKYRGATVNLGIKHWIEVSRVKADVIHQWMATNGRRERRLLATVQKDGWGGQGDDYFKSLLGAWKVKG